MYIAATPVAITMRYTETSAAETIETCTIAIFSVPWLFFSLFFSAENGTGTANAIGAQAQGFFARHLVLLFVAILFICMIEDNALQINPYFSAFAIIFETISAYGAPFS